MAKKKKDVSISLESVYPEYEGVNPFDLIDEAFGDPSKSTEMAEIMSDDLDEEIPEELKERVDKTVISNRGFYHDYR